MTLALLLVRQRLRMAWNGLRRPRRRSMRVAWALALLAPIAYVGLFATALDSLSEVPIDVQARLVGLVTLGIVMASAAGKMAMGEAVMGGSGENEFLLARPVSLPRLVVARALAGAVTDVFDALFLFPVLLAAALSWRLGLPGVALVAVASVVVQVGVSAAADAGQMVVVRLVPAPRRRLAWALLALFAALTMAFVWVGASWLLRRPQALVTALEPWQAVLGVAPGMVIVGPVAALALAGGVAALVALGGLMAASGALLLAAAVAARWVGRGGWEQAGAPWAEAARRPVEGARITPLTKDFHLLVRDRARLVTLLALPAIFIGIQVFGSAGWSWVADEPRHAAVLAFSMAAYMATFGPLGHMESERRAFWLLRAAPVPLGRLFAWKAVLWSTLIGAAGLAVYLGVVLAGPIRLQGEALTLGGLVLLGSVTVSWLAIGVASGAADFSDERSRAVGVGTVYLFLVLAGLFDVVLVSPPEVQLPALLLYGIAVALHWIAGVDHAAHVLDPPPRSLRPVVAADGATLALLLALGTQAQAVATAKLEASAPWGAALWAGLIALVALVYLVRRSRHWFPTVGLSLALAAAGAIQPLAEELAVRGIVQRGLPWRWIGFLVAALLSLAVGAHPAAAVLPGLAFALTGQLPAALAVRLGIELWL